MITNSPYIYLTEIFSSVQGESSSSGMPTVFVRLSGCNLRCTWCDTTYSFKRGQKHTIQEIISFIQESGLQYVCITGGEPLLQKPVYSLMKELCSLGYKVSVETGGSLCIGMISPQVVTILDIKCPGSGMSHKNLYSNLGRLRAHDEIKFVIKDRSDYDFAVGVCKEFSLFSRQVPALFSPVFEDLDPQELIKWILEDQLPVRLNLQTHKYIWHPATQGV